MRSKLSVVMVALAALILLVSGGGGRARAGGVETAGTSLIGVSCWSTTGCIGVGDFLGGASDATLAGKWNGHSWTHLATPNAAGAVLSELNDVSCTSASHCVALGTSNFNVAVESWNGSSWKLWQPAVPPPVILTAISCGSSSACEAVGDRTNEKDAVVAGAEKWDGASLHLQTMPNVVGGELLSVSCQNAAHCMAVGDVTLSSSKATAETLAEEWSGGAWHRVSTPNPGAAGRAKDDQLLSVSCVTSNHCIAVGQQDNVNAVRALAEEWNGKTWRVLKTARGSSFTLFGVSCAKDKNCMAVGKRGSGTLAQAWNGKTWRVLKTPTSSGAFFNAVSCPKVASCLAVGTRNNHATLSEIWNGKKWRALKALKP
jgi:hypothetical protein